MPGAGHKGLGVCALPMGSQAPAPLANPSRPQACPCGSRRKSISTEFVDVSQRFRTARPLEGSAIGAALERLTGAAAQAFQKRLKVARDRMPGCVIFHALQ